MPEFCLFRFPSGKANEENRRLQTVAMNRKDFRALRKETESAAFTSASGTFYLP